VSRGLAAGLVAGAVSGVPSTLAALARGRDPLEATLAAGSILLPREPRRGRLVVAAAPVHLGVSLFWGVVLERVLPVRHRVVAGAAAGLAIAALDLGVLARPFPRVRALPLAPQLADHIAYGATAGFLLAR
jgi:hypothetical protein